MNTNTTTEILKDDDDENMEPSSEPQVFFDENDYQEHLKKLNEQALELHGFDKIVIPSKQIFLPAELRIFETEPEDLTGDARIALTSFTDLMTQTLGEDVINCLKEKYGGLRKFVEPSNPGTQCDNVVGGYISGETPCWICGIPIESTNDQYYLLAPECEHIFPIAQALIFTGLYATPIYDSFKLTKDKDNYVKELRKEYRWAHRICNQVKNDTHFISFNDKTKKFFTDTEKINEFLLNLETTDTFGGGSELCKKIGEFYKENKLTKDYEIVYDDNDFDIKSKTILNNYNIQNPSSQKLGEDILLKRMSRVQEVCNRIINTIDQLKISHEQYVRLSIGLIEQYAATEADCVESPVFRTRPTVSNRIKTNISEYNEFDYSNELIDYFTNNAKVFMFGNIINFFDKYLKESSIDRSEKLKVKNDLLIFQEYYKQYIIEIVKSKRQQIHKQIIDLYKIKTPERLPVVTNQIFIGYIYYAFYKKLDQETINLVTNKSTIENKNRFKEILNKVIIDNNFDASIKSKFIFNIPEKLEKLKGEIVPLQSERFYEINQQFTLENIGSPIAKITLGFYRDEQEIYQTILGNINNYQFQQQQIEKPLVEQKFEDLNKPTTNNIIDIETTINNTNITTTNANNIMDVETEKTIKQPSDQNKKEKINENDKFKDNLQENYINFKTLKEKTEDVLSKLITKYKTVKINMKNFSLQFPRGIPDEQYNQFSKFQQEIEDYKKSIRKVERLINFYDKKMFKIQKFLRIRDLDIIEGVTPSKNINTIFKNTLRGNISRSIDINNLLQLGQPQTINNIIDTETTTNITTTNQNNIVQQPTNIVEQQSRQKRKRNEVEYLSSKYQKEQYGGVVHVPLYPGGSSFKGGAPKRKQI